MKRNKYFLLLGALALSLSACTLASENGSTNDNNQPQDVTNEDTGNENNNTRPNEGDNNNNNNNNGNDNNNTNPPKPNEGNGDDNKPVSNDVALEDSLLYSHNRLKNADFSFNFSMKDNGTPKKNLTKRDGDNYNNGEGVYTENDDGTWSFDYSFRNGPYQKSDYDFFADREQELNGLRREALAVSTITAGSRNISRR